MSNRKETPQDRYLKNNAISVCFRVMKNTESDIIERLEAEPNKAGYIKRLIRADIARNKQ